jgi:exodeoxyribonuclease VII large subunit
MNPSEELRFDFGVAEGSSDGIDPVSGAGAAISADGAEKADDLLARIQRVQEAAVRQTPPKKRSAAKRRPKPGDDDHSTRRHPSQGPVLASVPESATDEVILEPELGEVEDEHEGDLEPESLSIAEFYARVRQALRNEFAEEVWVTGEIRSMRESRGHHYFELGDHSADSSGRQAAQQLQVTCWARDWPGVASALAAAGVDLEVGRVVRVRGKVGVWDGASKLQFTLTALDIEALLGGIAAARRRLLALLEAEGLLRANALLVVPLVPLRIGLVTSPGTEAHHDFVGELERSGIAFEIQLEGSLVQGADAPAQIAAALRRLEAFSPDIAVVIRGGGARGDLACFDAEDVARAIAMAPFPVWTGIGHTGDRAVADEVAGRAFITPTACGEAIVATVVAYWEDVQRRINSASALARARLDAQAHRVLAARERLSSSVRYQLDRRTRDLVLAATQLSDVATDAVVSAAQRLSVEATSLRRAADRAVAAEETALERRTQVLRAFDPRRQLERGWSLTRVSSGRIIRSASEVAPGELLVTQLADGEVASIVREAIASNEKDENR